MSMNREISCPLSVVEPWTAGLVEVDALSGDHVGEACIAPLSDEGRASRFYAMTPGGRYHS